MEIPRTDDGHYECPTCGDTETKTGKPFMTKGAVRCHHKQIHGESLAHVMVECNHCGDRFATRVSDDSRYCSHECSNAARWKRRREAATSE